MGTTLSFQAPFLESILEWKEFIPSKTWFENEIRLLSGKVMGQYDADRMPHVERIFEEIDKLSVTTITLMTASQTSKTTVGVGVIFKYADTEPSDCLIMFPRESELKKMYENKVKKLLDGCNTLLEKIKNTQAEDRKKGKDLLIKVNGIVINILATNNTKSISTKFNYYDEVVEFPIGKLEEAMERAKSFNESGEKFLITSTQHPTKGGEDQINFYFNVSELKLQYWAYCPGCKEHYYPEPETLVYPTIDEYKESVGIDKDTEIDVYKILSEYAPYVRENARLQCPHCNHKINNETRRKLILDKKFKWVEVEPLTIDENNIVTAWKQVDTPKENYKSVGFDINTLAIESYNMGDIAKDLIQAEYDKSKISRMQVLYVGYFNRIYRVNIKKRESSDILLLTNKLKSWVVPNDTAKLYFIVDTQKDHYWWMVMAVQWGKLFNVVAHGKAYEDNQLKELMFKRYFTQDGEERYIDRATIDMRGYQRAEQTDEDGEVIESKVNTTERIKELIIQINLEARQNGFAKRDEHFLWGTMGQPQIKISAKELEEANKRGENPTGEMFLLKTIENKENPDFTYKVLHISNLAAKTELFQAINDNIDNFKNEAEGLNPQAVENLYFINEDMRQEGLNRANPRNEDFEKMLTSEIFDYDIKNGKMQPYKTFIRIRKRNDQLDNSATAVALASYDNIALGGNKVKTHFDPAALFNSFKKK
jgi:hypothetical protein